MFVSESSLIQVWMRAKSHVGHCLHDVEALVQIKDILVVLDATQATLHIDPYGSPLGYLLDILQHLLYIGRSNAA